MLVGLVLAVWVSSTAARYHEYAPVNLVQTTTDIKGEPNPEEHVANYWYNRSILTIQEQLAKIQRNGPAKNVILFLGDGMSIATVTAARIYLGQVINQSGEEQRLSFEKFPYTGLSKTYCVNSQVADSACSGTAYLSGVKNNLHTIGVTADVAYLDWQAMQNTSWHTPSILQWAQESGKGTGIVTTCKVTDASPTATYAHTASRYWQTDQDILADQPTATNVKDITSQLIEDSPGINIKVILGGGRQVFLPKETQDEYGSNGTRGDKKNLIQAWKDARQAANVTASYIYNTEQLLNLDVNNTEYVLGLFHTYHMDFHLLANPTLQPTLAEMTSLAIRMMQKEANGYFLFIEGGRIDHGHHENKAHLALDEAVEFHKAIQLAVDMTSEEDTLIVVTADHAHTMTLSGYPSRGSDIFTTLQSTQDHISYSTLSYANGPNTHGFNPNLTQHDIATDNRGDNSYTFPTIYKLGAETHDGQDVAVYARGPCAHLLVGNYEQTVIPHVMGYAARVGPAAVVDLKSSGRDLSAHALGILILATITVVKVALL